MMKRVGLLISFIAVVCSAQTTYDGKMGIEFSANGSGYVGMRYHFTDVYCIRPNLSFTIGDQSNLGFLIDNNIYLPPLPIVDHYIHVGLQMEFPENQNSRVILPAGYGLQHQLSETLGLFGSVGINWGLTDDYFTTVKTGIGLVLYMW